MAAAKYFQQAALALGAVVAFAQMPAQADDFKSLGRTATHEEIKGWSINVFSDGTGLPQDSEGTVKQGEQVYQNACLACHGVKLEGGLGPALVGGKGSLTTDKPIKTIGSYWPYATTVFDYVRRSMPFQSPQSLTDEEVYSVTGYLLHMNGLMDADAKVNAKTLMEVKMPNRDAFYVDDRPDASNERCMQDCLKKPQP